MTFSNFTARKERFQIKVVEKFSESLGMLVGIFCYFA